MQVLLLGGLGLKQSIDLLYGYVFRCTCSCAIEHYTGQLKNCNKGLSIVWSIPVFSLTPSCWHTPYSCVHVVRMHAHPHMWENIQILVAWRPCKPQNTTMIRLEKHLQCKKSPKSVETRSITPICYNVMCISLSYEIDDYYLLIIIHFLLIIRCYFLCLNSLLIFLYRLCIWQYFLSESKTWWEALA